LLNRRKKDVDARDKRGHDENALSFDSTFHPRGHLAIPQAPEISLIAAATKV
jgi:hypothetical protein